MIRCSINTPISELTSCEGDMILLPAREGEIGVLKHHMRLIVELVPGEVKIMSNGNIKEKHKINSAIAYIKGDSVEILESF